MIFGLFTLLVAIIISAVSAFYSITGLTAIFTGAFWSIVIMGGALELGKITATVWLHKFWHRANWQFKAYLIPAIVVLMFITSMGTFGYLSAAHLSQSTASEDISSQVSLYDEKIKTQKDNIDAAKKALQQMDAQVDQLLSRTTDDKGVNRAVQVRKQQVKERKSLQNDIELAQKEIAVLQTQREPLAAKSRVAESHIGPVKYIAALIYGDNPDANLLERAVRWVIILLVLVFDPLALVLILAAEQTIEWARTDRKAKKAQDDARKGWHQEWVPDTEAWPEWDGDYEPDDGPLTEEQIQTIQETANVDLDNVVATSTLFDTEKEFFEHGKEIAKAIDDNDGQLPDNYASTQAYLKGPVSWFKSTIKEGLVPKTEPTKEEDPLDIPILEGEEMWAQEAIDTQPQVEIPSFEINEEQHKSNAGFGTVFPLNPKRGDLFLRVDYLPNRLYKWNGQKWIEGSKDIANHYVHEEAYINYLVERVRAGEYNFHDLSKAEQEEVLKHLDYNTRQSL